MKNMNEKTKKWLVVAGGLAVSAVLVVMILNQFKVPPTEDITIPAQSSEVQDIVVDSPDITEKEDDITVPPIEIPNQTESKNGAVDTGTEQTIQPDIPEKPTYTEEKLTNSSGKKGKLPIEKNPTPTKPQEKPSNPTGKLPGFNNVPNAGENQVVEGVSDGDINKQVGTMD